jgi:hypothetical protein
MIGPIQSAERIPFLEFPAGELVRLSLDLAHCPKPEDKG